MTDADEDGYGDNNPSSPDVEQGSDCDDNDLYARPGTAEKEADPTACMRDRDGDGYGDDNPSNTEVTAGTDCYDTVNLFNYEAYYTHPQAAENESDRAHLKYHLRRQAATTRPNQTKLWPR